MGILNYDTDIHGMTAPQAKKHLESLLRTLPNKYSQITVIHGYQDGTRLLTMVRGKGLTSKRIKQKILTMNRGETILVLHDLQK